MSRFLTAHQHDYTVGYTVPFTLVHAAKYKTEDKLKIQTIQKLNTIQKQQTMHNTQKQNTLVTSYDTPPGSGVGLFYNVPEPTRQ